MIEPATTRRLVVVDNVAVAKVVALSRSAEIAVIVSCPSEDAAGQRQWKTIVSLCVIRRRDADSRRDGLKCLLRRVNDGDELSAHLRSGDEFCVVAVLSHADIRVDVPARTGTRRGGARASPRADEREPAGADPVAHVPRPDARVDRALQFRVD